MYGTSPADRHVPDAVHSFRATLHREGVSLLRSSGHPPGRWPGPLLVRKLRPLLGGAPAARATAPPQLSQLVAFATAPPEYLGQADTDRPLHECACAALGIDLEYRVWSDPAVAWADYDLVIVRSTWDYLGHLDDFTAWLDRVGRLGSLHNPAPVIRWNLDKRYLLDLDAAGVPVIPTTMCPTAEEAATALGGLEGEVVVKPVVSAGSRLTGRFAVGDPAASRLALQILDEGTAVLVQPAVASVAYEGEVSTLVFGGVVSHSVRKGPLLALGGGLIGGSYSERLAPEVLTASQRDVVNAASDAVARLVIDRFVVDQPLLYARIDMVTLDDGTDVVLEVELAEPAFFLKMDPAAADRFAQLLAQRLQVRPS
jgi:glutathione synthase/RimK-type ligase-like ATP-grasp enzyme